MSSVEPPPAYPKWPPPPYPPQQPTTERRRWPAFAAGAAAGAIVAATIASIITANVTGGSGHTSTPAAPVTITETPAPPPTPTPLPAADANRRTCNTWLAAGELINSGAAELAVLPSGVKILDPAVRANPEWTAAVQRASELYGQAADKLAAGIAPGTTAILNQTADAAVAALRVLSTGYGSFDDAAGNTYHIMKESADTMDVVCERLAPR